MKSFFREPFLELAVGSLPRRLSLLDIGARGGVQWPWDQVRSELLSVILIEPDAIEAERLRTEFEASKRGVVLPVALWRDERNLTLNLNRSPGTSSVYKPAKEFLSQFPEAERFDAVETVEVSARTIDGLVLSGQMPAVDFAKIDAQGAELAILEGGVDHLATNLVGLELEIAFARLYAGQPVFAEVDTFVREELGLELWDLRKSYWKYRQGADVHGPTKGRLVFGDALYLRSLCGIGDWLDAMPSEAANDKVAMLVLTALVFGYVDYAFTVLNAPAISRRLDKSVREQLQRIVNTYGSGFRPFRNGNGHLYLLLDAIAKAFKPSHNGWATIGNGLGSRRRGPFWC